MATKKKSTKAATAAKSTSQQSETPPMVRRAGDSSRMLSRDELEEIHGKETLEENERVAHEHRSQRRS